MTYTYGSTDWRDELTGISTVTGADTVNEQIVYDANGNAVSYRGATLTWNGKQLASWTKGSDSISYAYDENGLRLRKTVNGTATEYYYNGSILMSLVTGDDTLLFSYDQGGNVVSVNHNGTEYYYLRNGQGEERSDARARHLNGTTVRCREPRLTEARRPRGYRQAHRQQRHCRGNIWV